MIGLSHQPLITLKPKPHDHTPFVLPQKVIPHCLSPCRQYERRGNKHNEPEAPCESRTCSQTCFALHAVGSFFFLLLVSVFAKLSESMLGGEGEEAAQRQ